MRLRLLGRPLDGPVTMPLHVAVCVHLGRFKRGGDWRRTYVLLRPDPMGEERATWMVTRSWVAWSLLKNPHGLIPFAGYRILWMVTFFFDRTAWPIEKARPVVMEVKAVPRWEPAAEGERLKTQKWFSGILGIGQQAITRSLDQDIWSMANCSLGGTALGGFLI